MSCKAHSNLRHIENVCIQILLRNRICICVAEILYVYPVAMGFIRSLCFRYPRRSQNLTEMKSKLLSIITLSAFFNVYLNKDKELKLMEKEDRTILDNIHTNVVSTYLHRG